MIVLEERKQGTIKILSQIGKDTAITEQQIKVVKAQLDRISRLKKVFVVIISLKMVFTHKCNFEVIKYRVEVRIYSPCFSAC